MSKTVWGFLIIHAVERQQYHNQSHAHIFLRLFDAPEVF